MSALQFGLTPKMKPLPPNRSVLVAALDVGTSKIACLIGRLRPSPPEDSPGLRSHSVEVVGFGHTLARGMKAGTVIDLAEAEAAVRQCADLAERTAKMQLDSVIVSVSAGRPTSELISASIEVAGSAIGERGISRVLTAGSRHSARAGRAVLHSLPIGYVLAHARGLRHARGLNARVVDAERIKTLYGSVLTGASDERDMIAVPPVDNDEREAPHFVSRASLARIIKPRIEEILEMVRDRLAASPFAAEPRGRVVLTGGAGPRTRGAALVPPVSLPPGRLAGPLGIAGLPEEAKG